MCVISSRSCARGPARKSPRGFWFEILCSAPTFELNSDRMASEPSRLGVLARLRAAVCQDCFEGSHDGRIELSADGLGKPEARHATRHCLAVRTIRGHRVESIRDSNDSRQKRDIFLNQPVGVAPAVDALVVMAHYTGDL